MSTHDNFSNDNDDVERSASNENVESNSRTEAVDQSESTNDGSNDASGAPTVGADDTTIGPAADDATDGTVLDDTHDDPESDNAGASDSSERDDPDVDLPQLLRQVSRVMRREFRAAAKDSGFDPRDFGRMRRGRRGWDDDEMVADGAPGPEEPVTYGPPRGRRGWGPAGDVNPEELRRRMRDLRDTVGDKVEDVLSSEEFEDLKASLSKIVDAFGADRCGDDSRRDDSRRGGRRFGPGFGPGRRGFDPFGWAEDRRDRERDHDQEVQDAFERGFAAGFEQGRNS
ncbi:hypothetical protein [Brevibacterium atlanticum]|uniref:hypothetical protein n=1 Tax=Brevibacterium atlanticum TaxID=2697563 RepID=UPI001424A127|nr:hypothetical protein [Brevibacterium atlanticum]